MEEGLTILRASGSYAPYMMRHALAREKKPRRAKRKVVSFVEVLHFDELLSQ